MGSRLYIKEEQDFNDVIFAIHGYLKHNRNDDDTYYTAADETRILATLRVRSVPALLDLVKHLTASINGRNNQEVSAIIEESIAVQNETIRRCDAYTSARYKLCFNETKQVYC